MTSFISTKTGEVSDPHTKNCRKTGTLQSCIGDDSLSEAPQLNKTKSALSGRINQRKLSVTPIGIEPVLEKKIPTNIIAVQKTAYSSAADAASARIEEGKIVIY